MNGWVSMIWLIVFARPRSFALTPAAKAALLQDMARITKFTPVASVLRAESGTDGSGLTRSGKVEHRGPHWMVGFYDLAKLSRWRVVELDGIRFTFLCQPASPRLDGSTLDYVLGHYAVHERDA